MLDDARIRDALKRYILAKSNKPRMLIEELRIHNGNAIADVVAVYKFLHGFEIKGETDSIARLKVQSCFYSASFPFVTLVTTQNHFAWAEKNLPDFWGILIAAESGPRVIFSYARPSKTNPMFSRSTALTMLWKNELTQLGKEIRADHIRQSDSRAVLVEKISPRLSKGTTSSLLSNVILDRYL